MFTPKNLRKIILQEQYNDPKMQYESFVPIESIQKFINSRNNIRSPTAKKSLKLNIDNVYASSKSSKRIDTTTSTLATNKDLSKLLKTPLSNRLDSSKGNLKINRIPTLSQSYSTPNIKCQIKNSKGKFIHFIDKFNKEENYISSVNDDLNFEIKLMNQSRPRKLVKEDMKSILKDSKNEKNSIRREVIINEGFDKKIIISIHKNNIHNNTHLLTKLNTDTAYKFKKILEEKFGKLKLRNDMKIKRQESIEIKKVPVIDFSNDNEDYNTKVIHKIKTIETYKRINRK